MRLLPEVAKDAHGCATEEEGLVDIRTDDWTKYVEPFWGKVIQTALTGEWQSHVGSAPFPAVVRA